jgi:hypothetical protein
MSVDGLDPRNRLESGVVTAARASGRCPWSDCPCVRADRCVMTASEACIHLIQRCVSGCPACKQKSGGDCADMFLCFLDVREAEHREARRRHSLPLRN